MKKIREILFRIKLIKLNAWEKIFIEKIADCRKEELHYLNIDAFYWTLMSKLTLEELLLKSPSACNKHNLLCNHFLSNFVTILEIAT